MITKLQLQVEKLKSENLEYVSRNEDLATDIDALRNIILNGEFSDDIKEKLHKLGFCGGSKQEMVRSATMIGKALKSLDSDIKEDDVLEREQERIFMDILESLISGKISSVGQNETKALLSLRKEYYRRDMEIKSSNKILQNFDRVNIKLNLEIERLEDSLIQQYEYNQSLLKSISNLKLMNQQAFDRETLANLKLYNNELVRDFGEDNSQISELVSQEDVGLRESIKRMSSIRGSVVDDSIRESIQVHVNQRMEKQLAMEEQIKSVSETPFDLNVVNQILKKRGVQP